MEAVQLSWYYLKSSSPLNDTAGINRATKRAFKFHRITKVGRISQINKSNHQPISLTTQTM